MNHDALCLRVLSGKLILCLSCIFLRSTPCVAEESGRFTVLSNVLVQEVDGSVKVHCQRILPKQEKLLFAVTVPHKQPPGFAIEVREAVSVVASRQKMLITEFDVEFISGEPASLMELKNFLLKNNNSCLFRYSFEIVPKNQLIFLRRECLVIVGKRPTANEISGTAIPKIMFDESKRRDHQPRSASEEREIIEREKGPGALLGPNQAADAINAGRGQ